MIDLSIDRDLEARLDQVRRLGREHLRPLGIEADRRREPVPPDHRFFALAWRMGIGQPLGVEERPASGPRTGARRGVVLAEEMSYWDRGMSVAMPGLGLGGPPLLGMGTPEQKERFFAPFRDREPPANLLGGERHYAERAGFKGAMKSFNATRPAIAAMAVGIARAAYDASRDFARAHYALDRAIPRYQRVREKLARMARKIEAGRLLCWRAAYLADLEQPNEIEAPMAKAFAAGIAQEATGLAVETLGAAGVTADLFVGMQTKRIRVGQLGIVLPAENPIRVAENIAMLDHMTGGRANAGFARGYQRRWVDVMAQQTHGIHGALPHQHDAVDEANRAAVEECFRIIKQAWSEDLLSYEGRYWRIPPGATPWDLESTRRYGAGVVDGVVRAVGVVPKPLQQPHPPLFQPFASSERSIRWCAAEDRKSTRLN